MDQRTSTRTDRDGPVGRRLPVGLGLAVLAAAVGSALWVVAHGAGAVAAAIVAPLVGVAVGTALRGVGARAAVAAVTAVVLTLLAGAVAQNFAQRQQLLEGIEQLQADWATLTAPPEPAEGEPLSDDPGCAQMPSGAVPVAILDTLPPEALLCMTPQQLAEVWDDVAEDRRAQLPDDAVAEVMAAHQAAAGQPGEDFDEDAYEIPEAVLACAPPPDFTQPDAAAGLGFDDGVPLLLPAADLGAADERGDGLEVEAPSPVCFVRENAAANPLEPVSWLIGIALAGILAAGGHRRRAD